MYKVTAMPGDTLTRTPVTSDGRRHPHADALVAALLRENEPIGCDETRCPDEACDAPEMLAELDDRIRYVVISSGGYIKWCGFELASWR